MKILVVEDHPATAQSIELMLKAEGFQPYTTDLGEEAIDLAKVYEYDAITLDMNLADMSGLDVLRAIRGAKLKTPIIMLTGCSDTVMKVRALELGADDYMTKPFQKDELVARLHAIIRRTGGHVANIVETGNIAVDIGNKTVKVSGNALHLTGKEYLVLELLSLRKGTTLTKEMFLNHLYGGMDEPELKIIDVFICKIRRKLSVANAGDHHIETVWGKGYSLRDALETKTPAHPYSHETATARVIGRLRGGQAVGRELLIAAQCQPESLGYLLQRLRAQGLIERVGDRRAAMYSLTPSGESWADNRLGRQVAA